MLGAKNSTDTDNNLHKNGQLFIFQFPPLSKHLLNTMLTLAIFSHSL